MNLNELNIIEFYQYDIFNKYCVCVHILKKKVEKQTLQLLKKICLMHADILYLICSFLEIR